jgi:hypothetical protein
MATMTSAIAAPAASVHQGNGFRPPDGSWRSSGSARAAVSAAGFFTGRVGEVFMIARNCGKPEPVLSFPRDETTMIELQGNLHIHTGYSDGTLYHAEIAAQAADAGLDFLFITDHNVLVRGVNRWFEFPGGRRVLLQAGEEIHQQDRIPQKNHLLALGISADLGRMARNPQKLIDAVNASGGAAFLAHPYDPAAPLVREDPLGWVSWDVRGYAGLEIWNYMSEFKALFHNYGEMIFYALFPSFGIRSPDPQTLARWDQLLAEGARVSAVGGSDSHGQAYTLGPLRKIVFPYRYLFRAVNTHVLVDALSGDEREDGRAIVAALRKGRGWVAYDLAKPTRGFRFWAVGPARHVEMGEEAALSEGAVLRAEFPFPARWTILRAGAGPVARGSGTNATFSVTKPGAYRLEARRPFRGRLRGWIFSNPIYIR